MVKKRVHELAKELNIESKEIVNKLSQMGITVKSHMSTLEDSEVKSLLKFYKKDKADSRPVEASAVTNAEKTDMKASDKTETNAAQARGRATGPAVRTNQDRQGEKKREMGITDQRKPEKGKGFHGEQRREGPSARGEQFRGPDRGPGMVDRVPSRPPDRRFQERPKQADKPAKPWGQPKPEYIKHPRQAETMTEQMQQDQTKQDISADRQPERPVQGDGSIQRTDRPVSARTEEKQRFPENDKDRLAIEARTPRAGERGYRQGGPQGQRTVAPHGQRAGGQHSPRPDGPQGQRPYAPQGQRPGGPQGQRPGGPQGQRPGGSQGQRPGGPQGQRPGGSQGQRPGGPQGQRPGGPQGARPKPYDRPATGNTVQPAWPKSDNPAPRPQVFQDDRSRAAGDKNKTGEKPKTAPKTDGQHKKPPVRGRSDKRNAIANLAEERLRAGGPKKKGNVRQQEQRLAQPLEKKPVVLGEHTTVQELALKLYRRPAELIKKLMQLGVLATINQEIDIDTATILAEEFGFEVEIKLPVDIEAVLMQEPEEDPELSQYRPCVVTVMGHVDHGKTSLLDAIRETNVTATEAGGITQHIGAYQVEHNGKRITFVDTPGHEAFTAMRARGAQVTDIAILVVAADDGVMPQTIEALNHAKEAKVPIIVAINKIDKPGANSDRVKQQLTEHGLVAEEWGGETIFVNVSALKREGLNELLEMILLVAEIGELKANPNKPARGTVIEAELDKGRGPVATVLVQSGSLNIGDTIIAGSVFGRVRAMMDDKGKRTKKAGPSTPVEVLGLSEVPKAGDVFIVVEDEKLARTIVSRRQTKKREEELKTTTRISLEDLFKHIQEGQIKELGIIVKADVQGSVEALRQALERLNTGEVKVNIIHSGVGAIREHDIMLASASNAIIIGFNVRPDINARKAAENERVDVRLYRVIYDAIEDVRAAMSGLLDPEYREVMLGRAEIRKIFRASKIGTIAGCYVLEGKIERDAGVRVVRDGIVVHEGKLDSLKRFKDDVKEVVQGYECGLALEKYNEIQEGDIIEAFTTETVKRELS